MLNFILCFCIHTDNYQAVLSHTSGTTNVRTPLRRGVLDTTLCDKSLSVTCVKVDGFLRFPPPIKLKYC